MSAATNRAVTAEIAEWAAAVAPERLPAEVTRHCRRAILDYLAATVAGASAPAAAAVRSYLRDAEGGNGCTVIGTAQEASAAGAALANGTAAHALEVDDGYTPGSFHPGAPILSAVLAVAEREDSGGDDVVAATAVGYEVGCRLAEAGHPATWRRGFHNTPLAGVFGAAVAASRLLGADASATASALGLAGSHAGGLFEFLSGGTESKRLHAGKAARDGLVSAELVARGLSGPPSVLEGPHGYAVAYTGGELDAEALTAGLGTDWRMLRTYCKPYPCCRHVHGPIDAVLAMAEEEPIDPAAVDAIEVATYAGAARHASTRVESLVDAQMSIPYGVAAAVLHGEVAVAHFEEPARSDPRLVALMDRVKVTVGEDCDRDYPRMRPARVCVRAGGRERSVRVDQPLGEPDRPLSDADLEAKVRRLSAPVLGPEVCEQLIDGVWSLGDPRGLFRLLRRPDQ